MSALTRNGLTLHVGANGPAVQAPALTESPRVPVVVIPDPFAGLPSDDEVRKFRVTVTGWTADRGDVTDTTTVKCTRSSARKMALRMAAAAATSRDDVTISVVPA